MPSSGSFYDMLLEDKKTSHRTKSVFLVFLICVENKTIEERVTILSLVSVHTLSYRVIFCSCVFHFLQCLISSGSNLSLERLRPPFKFLSLSVSCLEVLWLFYFIPEYTKFSLALETAPPRSHLQCPTPVHCRVESFASSC